MIFIIFTFVLIKSLLMYRFSLELPSSILHDLISLFYARIHFSEVLICAGGLHCRYPFQFWFPCPELTWEGHFLYKCLYISGPSTRFPSIAESPSLEFYFRTSTPMSAFSEYHPKLLELLSDIESLRAIVPGDFQMSPFELSSSFVDSLSGGFLRVF